jgi:outer membrane protein TolC
MKKKTTAAAFIMVCALDVRAARAQQAEPSVGLQLAALQQAAVDADPRFAQLKLQQAQTDLRVGNIDAERKPSIGVEGQVQWQSDVPTPPPFLPGGTPLFLPPKDTYDAHLRIEQRIFDPTVGTRADLERAQLAESQSRVRVALFGLRQEVNNAFFAAALLQARTGALAAAIANLETRLRETTARVNGGTALAADAATVEAALLQRRQDQAELRVNRAAALARLSALTARPIPEDTNLELPDIRDRVAQARTTLNTRARPEYEAFARSRDRVGRQQETVATQTQFRVSAYGRVGYARPGLNIIDDQFEFYGLVGVQLQWKPFDWHSEGREREALALQSQIIAADEAAFTKTIERTSDTDLRTIDRLAETIALDDRIVALREQIDRSTETRFRENVVTASEYLDRNTELLDARFTQAGHRVELAQAGAKLLTTLGLEVR